MKKIAFIVVAFIVTQFMFSCGPSKADLAEKARQDSIRVADSIHRADSIAQADSIKKAVADSLARDSAAIAFVTDMYNNKKFESFSWLSKHCTKIMLKKLAADCDYDIDGCLATWDFRTDYQDGPSERHEIIKVTPIGDAWYEYSFYDMGNKGKRSIKLIYQDGSFMVDDIF